MYDLAYPPTDRVSGCWGKGCLRRHLPSQDAALLLYPTTLLSESRRASLGHSSTYPVGSVDTLLGFKPGLVPEELVSHL